MTLFHDFITYIYDKYIKLEVSLHFWWIWPTVWLLLLYLLGKKVGKKAAGDKPISHYFHLKLFILCGDKNFFNRIVQKLDEITADQ